jgi:hypothetical protein
MALVLLEKPGKTTLCLFVIISEEQAGNFASSAGNILHLERQLIATSVVPAEMTDD